jgi:hypothetical protein
MAIAREAVITFLLPNMKFSLELGAYENVIMYHHILTP